MPHLLDIQYAPSRRCSSWMPRHTTVKTSVSSGSSRTCSRSPTSTKTSPRVRTLLARRAWATRSKSALERDMTYSAPLKATLQLVINEAVNEQKRPRNIIEQGSISASLPLLTPLGTFGHQRCRTRHRQPASPVPGYRSRGVDPPERAAPDLGAHHPVPRLVGRVHRRHPRRARLRPHRQEEEVPRHRAASRVSATGATRTFSVSSSPFASST